MSIQANLKEVLADLPSGVRLVAVSKFHPNEAIEEAYTAGQRIFGESKVQEMTQKYETLPKDIEWHFIGHLQTNKIKYMAPYVAMIHGIDSYKLLVEVNKHACYKSISPKKRPSSVSALMNVGKCSKKEIGKNCIISKSAASWVWQPILMTQNKLRKNFVP